MTVRKMDNFSQFSDDEKKIDPGKQNTGLKIIVDEITLTVELILADEYLMTPIPEGATLVDAYIKSPSLGTQGKLEMGLKEYVNKAGVTVAEDVNSLVDDADAGGQAVLKRSDLLSDALSAEIGKGGAQPFLKPLETSDVGIGKKVQAVVIYSLA